MKNFLAFLCGSVFSLGLMISGMANPEKVLSFLDITGQWDASLAFVMIGAILVAIIPFQFAIRHPVTIFKQPIQFPKNKMIDRKLILGAVIFGIGWGMVGICPAPALTLIGLGHYQGFYFIVAMLAGIWGYHKWTGA